jgi:hypothetical protein
VLVLDPFGKGFPAIVFDYEDEHDDEDDLNTLRMASQGVGPTLILPYPDEVSYKAGSRFCTTET